MEVALINDKNRKYFKPILFDGETTGGEQKLQFGIIDEGSPIGATSLVFEDNFCDITSMYVLPDKRRRGCGKMMLDIAERIAEEEGCFWIDVDFARDVKAYYELFEANGYFCRDEEKIYELSKQDIFDSAFVKQSLKRKPSDAHFVSLENVSIQKKDELKKALAKEEIEFSEKAYPNLDLNLSGITMDKNENILSVMICSGDRDSVLVDLIFDFSNSTKGIFTTMIGFARILEKSDYEKVAMVPISESILRLLDNILGDKEKAERTISIFAYKVF